MPDSFVSPFAEDERKLMSWFTEGKIGRRTKGWNEVGTYSDWGIENYNTTLKRSYRWLYKKDIPECISWLKPHNRPNKNVKSQNLITEDEGQRNVKVLKNPHNKAIIYSLFDSGCRIDELLTLKNKVMEFEDDCGILSVTIESEYMENELGFLTNLHKSI